MQPAAMTYCLENALPDDERDVGDVTFFKSNRLTALADIPFPSLSETPGGDAVATLALGETKNAPT